MLFSPNTIELSILLLFNARIKKNSEPKLAIPKIDPPVSSAIVKLLESDFDFIRINDNPSIKAVKKTRAVKSKIKLFGTKLL